MHLNIEWLRPLRLKSGQREGLIYRVDLEGLPREGGVYVFARKWGSNYEALYVGQSVNLQARVRTHLNNLRVMRHLQNAANGHRVVLTGVARMRPGQRQARVLRTLERALIRHFLSEGHDLVNQQGVRIRRHEIASSGPVPRRFVPATVYLERGAGD